MLHIFLLIIKIIGIFLAVVLGIVVLLLLLLLFFPICYRIRGSHKEEWDVEVKAHFMGPVVNFRAWYREEFCYKFKVLWKTFVDSGRASEEDDGEPGTSKSKKGKSKKDKPKKAHSKKGKSTDWQLENEEADDSVFGQLERKEHMALLSGEESFEKTSDDEPETSGEADEPETSEEVDGPETFWDRVLKIWQAFRERIADFFASFGDRVQTVKGACAHMADFKDNLVRFYEDENVWTGFSKLKGEVVFLLKKLKPRKFKWYLKFGFEEPSSTGQALGVIAALSGILGKPIQAEPDFENKVLETDFKIKGSIQGFRLLRLLIKLMYDDDIQYFLKQGKGLRRN